MSYADRLARWAETAVTPAINRYPVIPPSINDRDADVWEPPPAVADAAGGDWPQRARVAAVALVADSKRENS